MEDDTVAGTLDVFAVDPATEDEIKIGEVELSDAGLLALVTGVAGARLSHVLENIGYYTNPNRSLWANFFDAINIRSGGLTYYGGFLLAFPSLVLYARYK